MADNDGWTPVAQGLPERAVPVFATVCPKKGKKVRSVTVATYWTPGKDHHADEASWEIMGDDYEILEVLAWCPTPAIFKG